MYGIGFWDLVAAVFLFQTLGIGRFLFEDWHRRKESERFLAECRELDAKLQGGLAKIERVK